MSNRKRRISSINKLPLAQVQWAFDRVVEERLDQSEIVAELNARLKALKLKPVSASAFCRWVERIRDGEIARPRIIDGDRRGDDLLEGLDLTPETHAAFKVFLNLFARDVRSSKEGAA